MKRSPHEDRHSRRSNSAWAGAVTTPLTDLLRDLPEDVRALTGNLPALVIWGERDPYLPSEFAERFGAGTVQLHPKLGHWPHRESAAQTAAEIGEFLAESALRAE